MEAIDDYAKSNFVTDHKGNVFRNNKEMCSKYGLKPSTKDGKIINKGYNEV
mgnify:CR=1 FL=1